MRRTKTVYFNPIKVSKNGHSIYFLVKSIDKSADMPYLNALMQVYFTTFPNKTIDNFLYFSTGISKPNL